jgi:hypothetical protein
MTRRAGAFDTQTIRDLTRHLSRNGTRETKKPGAGLVQPLRRLNKSPGGSKSGGLSADHKARLLVVGRIENPR